MDIAEEDGPGPDAPFHARQGNAVVEVGDQHRRSEALVLRQPPEQADHALAHRERRGRETAPAKAERAPHPAVAGARGGAEAECRDVMAPESADVASPVTGHRQGVRIRAKPGGDPFHVQRHPDAVLGTDGVAVLPGAVQCPAASNAIARSVRDLGGIREAPLVDAHTGEPALGEPDSAPGDEDSREDPLAAFLGDQRARRPGGRNSDGIDAGPR